MSEPTTAPAPNPPRVVRFALPILLFLGVAMFATAIFLPSPFAAKARSTEPTEIALPAPTFSLTERSGTTITNADLRGKVWIASFIFTRCNGPCPSVTGTMAKLQSELDLANQPNLRLVTFTVDPERDNPGELKKYADQRRAHPDRWLFLTGQEADLHKMMHDGFKIQASRSANPHPVEGQEFDHSTRLVLVDKAGTIRGYFDGFRGTHDENGEKYDESIQRLKKMTRELLTE